MGFEASPRRKKYLRDLRSKEEARWRAKCGPLTVTFVNPELLRVGAQAITAPRAPAQPPHTSRGAELELWSQN